MANGAKDVFGIKKQADYLLRNGQLVADGYTNIRQRHMWSNYTFQSVTPGPGQPAGPIDGTGLLASGDYMVFSTPIGQNGQGLPSGLQMTDRDTNFPGAGRISDQQNFAVWELGVGIWPARPDVVALDNTRMNFGDVQADDADSILGSVVVSHKELTNAVPLGLGDDFATPGGPVIVDTSTIDAAGNRNVAVTGGGLGEGAAAPPYNSGRQARLTRNGGTLPPAPGMRRKLDVPILLRNGDQFNFIFSFYRPVQLRTAKQGGTGSFTLRLDIWVIESFRRSG